MLGTRKYAYSILVGIYACPYCGRIVRKERLDHSRTGPKLERCPYCSNIYKTGKKFYSDLSKKEVNKYKAKKYYVALMGLVGFALSSYIGSKCVNNVELFSLFFITGIVSLCSGIIYFIGMLMWKSNKSDKFISNDLQLVELERQLSAEMKQRELQGITDSEKNLMEYSGRAFPSIILVVKLNMYQQYEVSLGDTITETQAKFRNFL